MTFEVVPRDEKWVRMRNGYAVRASRRQRLGRERRVRLDPPHSFQGNFVHNGLQLRLWVRVRDQGMG